MPNEGEIENLSCTDDRKGSLFITITLMSMPHKGWSCSGNTKYDVRDLIYGVCPQVISAPAHTLKTISVISEQFRNP